MKKVDQNLLKKSIRNGESSMKNFFLSIKEKFSRSGEEELPDYVQVSEENPSRQKIQVRIFTLDDFESIKPVVDAIREGYTIAIIKIRPLRDKDRVELKRAVNKLKKTVDAVGGDLAGLGEDHIIATPSFAEIYRPGMAMPQQPQQSEVTEITE